MCSSPPHGLCRRRAAACAAARAASCVNTRRINLWLCRILEVTSWLITEHGTAAMYYSMPYYLSRAADLPFWTSLECSVIYILL